MQDRPSVDELLEAVAGFLHDDVMPNTEGRLSFHARVASNVIEMLRRELASEEEHLSREWTGLDGLLGARVRPESLSELRAAVIERNRELSRRIQEGQADDGATRGAVVEHLRSVARDKLAVSNPKLIRD